MVILNSFVWVEEKCEDGATGEIALIRRGGITLRYQCTRKSPGILIFNGERRRMRRNRLIFGLNEINDSLLLCQAVTLNYHIIQSVVGETTTGNTPDSPDLTTS
jgi:hypothetical protein